MYIMGLNVEKSLQEINATNLLQYVSPDKQKRINAFNIHRDAQRVLVADLLVRSIVCKSLSKKNKDIQFQMNRYGKPYLYGAQGFHYNISHSGKWIVCAVDSEPVGIDVEALVPIDLNIAQNLFLTEEVKYIMDGPWEAITYRFYEVWTLKESYCKALGCGLSKDLKSFSLKIHGNANITIMDSVIHNRFLHLCRLDPGYCLAVCTCHNEIPDRVNVIDMQWIMDGL